MKKEIGMSRLVMEKFGKDRMVTSEIYMSLEILGTCQRMAKKERFSTDVLGVTRN